MFASHESVIIYLKHSNTAMALMPITQILVRPSESLMTLRSRYSIQNRIAPHTHDASRIFVCLSIDRPLFSDHLCAVDSTGVKIRHSLFRWSFQARRVPENSRMLIEQLLIIIRFDYICLPHLQVKSIDRCSGSFSCGQRLYSPRVRDYHRIIKWKRGYAEDDAFGTLSTGWKPGSKVGLKISQI